MFLRYFVVVLVGISLVACSTVPITGRSQLNLIPGLSMLTSE